MTIFKGRIFRSAKEISSMILIVTEDVHALGIFVIYYNNTYTYSLLLMGLSQL